MNEELLPCPFCGKSEALLVQQTGSQWSVCCGNCGVETIWIDGEKAAIARWNRRAQRKPLTDGLRELAETAIRGSGGDLTPTLDFESACSPQAILSLLEENEALARDAGRYRWLRTFNVDSYLAVGKLEALDAEIDAAMQPKGE